MSQMKPDKQRSNILLNVIFISVLVFFAGKETIVAQSFSIVSVGFLSEDRIEIRYDYGGGNIQSINVLYVPDLNEPVNVEVPDHLLEFDDDENIIVVSGFEPDVWTFILFAQFDDNSFVGSEYHSTIFLKEIKSSSIGCDVAVDALWMNYAIYASIDPPAPPVPVPFHYSELLISRYNTNTETCANAETPVYEEPLSFADSEISAPLHVQFDPDYRYCFRVRSFIKSDTDLYAYSNYKKDVSISDIVTPQHIEIISVDVDYDEENILVAGFSEDPDVSDFVFELYRSTDGIDFPDDPVQELLGKDIDQNQFYFIDDVDVNQGPYYYYVQSVHKECDIFSFDDAEIVPSVFLQTSLNMQGTDLQVVFEWNYDDSFDSYQTARLEINGQETPINFGDEDYSETLSIEELGTLITSRIEAEDAKGNPVRSNITELRIDILDRENIPNALRPDSDIPENRKFILPFLITNTGDIEYNIRIIDKNGQVVFSFNDRYHETDSAWNGQITNTGPAPAGAYVYELEYGIRDFPPETKRGVVYLIR